MKCLYVSMLGAAIAGAAASSPAEFIDFEQPTYPAATPCCQGLDGVDGWTADSGWIVFNGNSVLNTSQVMWNNGAANEFATRDFTTPLTSGTLTYELRPDDPGAGEAHWLLPQDSNGTWALQLLAHRKTKVNTNHEFELRLAGGGTAGTSPDVAAIDFGTREAWYEIRVDFDIADTTAGPNGTFDLQITRIDGTPQVVWDFDGQHIANPVLNIGKFTDNGSTATTGHATLIDNINLQPTVVLPSALAFTEVASSVQSAFTFQSVLDEMYRLQFSTNIPASVYNDLDYTIFGDGGTMHAFDNTPEGFTTNKTYRIITAPPLPAFSAAPITLDPPYYPDPGVGLTAELNGLDGWTSTTNGEWSVVGGQGRDGSNALIPDTPGNTATTQPMIRNLSPATDGTFSFEVWPANGGSGTTLWLILRDSTPPAPDDNTLLQLLYTADNGGNDEAFIVRDGAGATLATASDGAGSNIVSETWYLVTVDFDLADFTAGPNGTFDVQIDRIDNSSLVLDLDDQAIADAIDEVDQIFLNNTFTGGGPATRLDTIWPPMDLVPFLNETVDAVEMTFTNYPGGEPARIQATGDLTGGAWTALYRFLTAPTQTLFDAATSATRAYRGTIE